MRVFTLLLLLLLASGCNTFDFLSPRAVEGVFVGVEVQDGSTTIGDGPVLGVAFLGEATSIHDFASNVIANPDSLTVGTQGATAPLEASQDGLFITGVDALSSLVWTPGERVELDMTLAGETDTGSLVIPPGPAISGIPQALHVADLPTDWTGLTPEDIAQIVQDQADAAEFHPVGQPLTVDLSAEDYEYWVVFVSDQQGNVTFDNLPTQAADLVDWVVAAEPIDRFEIPGSAFPDPDTIYAVGVAGVVFADTKDYAGFNWLISNLGAGTLTVSALVTSS